MSKRVSQRGFTLIEVLLALALFAILLGALYSAFFASERAISGTGGRLLALGELRNCLDMLKREIESSVAGVNTEEDGFRIRDRDIFGNPASELAFTSVATPAGPGRVEYYLEEGEDERLVLLKRIVLPGRDPADAMEAEVLEDVEAFTAEALNGGQWVKTWQEATLPEEVRITIKVAVGERSLELRQSAMPRKGRRL